jgi:flagellar protein FliO/FliZ
MNGAFLQAFGGLMLIVVLMFAGAWLFRRSGGLQAMARGPVKLVGGISVGARERVLVLEVADSWVVVGVSPGQIRALHTLARQDSATTVPEAPAAGGFPQVLARLLQRGGGSGS